MDGLKLARPRTGHDWLILAYVVFTGYAAIFAALSAGEDQAWAIWAVCGYALGTVLLWRRRTAAALVLSLALVLVAPLIWISVDFGLETGMWVIDRSAELLLHHGSPYLPKDQVTSWLSYNPYLPVMALSGMPYAAGLPGLLGNSGVWLAVGTVVVLAAAFWIAAPARPGRRRDATCCAAIAVASPVVALNLAVITTDPPVLAFMLLSLALAAHPARSRTVWAALALAVACMLKDTAWVAIPVLGAMYWCRDGWREAVRFVVALLAGAVVLIAALAPATLIRPAAMEAMIRDTVLFPLGLTKYKTPAESLLPGHLLATMGTAGHVLSVGLLLAAGLAVAVSLVIWPLRDVRAVAWRIAIGLTLMFALGPDVRFGYFIYPLGLAGWLALTGPGVLASLSTLSRPAQAPSPGQPDEALR
jgi:glycosyl transferase family 87